MKAARGSEGPLAQTVGYPKRKAWLLSDPLECCILHNHQRQDTIHREPISRLAAMRSWQTEQGHLACRWSEVGQRFEYKPRWMQETAHIQSGYLPPLPDFASHSPFGGPLWFETDWAVLDSQSNSD